MKDSKIGFIITYFHTSNEGYELLKKNIEILSSENYYLVVASHSPLDKEIQEMCDYYFYQQKNIVDDRKYSHGVAESNLIEISLNHLKLHNIDWTYKVSYDIEINNMERFIDWRKDYKYDFVSCIWGSNIICTNSFFSNIQFLLDNITFYRDIESMFAVNNVLENCWEYDIRRKNLVDRTFAFENKYVFYGDNKIDILFYDYNQIDFWCDSDKFFIKNNSIDKSSLDIKIFDYYTDLCIYEDSNFIISKGDTQFVTPTERHGDENGYYLEVYLDELTVRKNIMIKDFDYKHEFSKKFKKLKTKKLENKKIKSEVVTDSLKEIKESFMVKEIFDLEILEDCSLRIKNISGQKVDAKIELFSYSYLNLIFDNFRFNIEEEKIIPISLSNFIKNDLQNNARFRAYSNGELIQEKILYKTYDRAYVLISNDKYEGITEKLIGGLSKYSNYQILHYTVNYDSSLNYKNLTNIRFDFGDYSDPQYMQFMKAPVFIDVLEKGFKHLVFLDSDIQVRPNIDRCFDIEQTSKGPILQKQHWDYVIANGEYIPGPLVREYLELGSEPGVDFVQPHPNGITNVVIFNQSHLELFREWQDVCFSDRIQEIRKTEFLHDELLLNCLLWKRKMYSRFEYIGLNVVDDKDVSFFYNIPNFIGNPFFDLNDYEMGHKSQSYMPHDKNDILFFHCVKEVNVADKINKIIEDREILKNESEEYFRNKLIDFYSDITTNKNRLLEVKPSFNFNFIDGPTFEIKNAGDKRYDVKFIDKKTNNILHSGNIGNNNWIRCNFMYYIDWRIQVESQDGDIFNYDINLEGKRVFINFESSALGDNLAWIPYVDEFRKKHNCKVICSTFWNKFFEDEYQEIDFVSPGSVVRDLAAMYRIGWFYNGDIDSINYTKVPNNFRLQPMQKTCSDILGLDYQEIVPKIKMNKNIKKEKMISIAIHGTAQTKYWNNPEGWQKLVDHLKSIGYKVVLVSKENDGYMGNSHPTGIEKLPAGDIEGVMDVIQRSEMFIGIGSGLSWLSWALGTKTVLISGFSYDYTEPSTNTIRIKTPQGKCTGCFNTHKLDPGDWNWCPLHKGTERHFECSKSITPEQVIEEISKHLEKIEYISNEFIF